MRNVLLPLVLLFGGPLLVTTAPSALAQQHGSLLIWPVNPVIEADKKAAALWLENPGKWPITLQVAGLIAVTVFASPWAVAAGVAVFGLGSGLHTLSRPWLIQRLYGVAEVGRLNGEVARAQGFARAAGPLLMVGAATLSSASIVLIGIAGLLAIVL